MASHSGNDYVSDSPSPEKSRKVKKRPASSSADMHENDSRVSDSGGEEHEDASMYDSHDDSTEDMELETVSADAEEAVAWALGKIPKNTCKQTEGM